MDLLHAEELKRLELERRLDAARLDILKSQINPHFLFNTLNVIAGMAKLEDAKTSERMIKALSILFRYNLKTTEAEIPLKNELQVVREYMYLQKMRFGKRIEYEIICNVDKEKVIVPSFIFQPLVENAIIHGLSKKEEGGKISIRIWSRKHVLHIAIIDTGIGIKSGELAEIRRKIQQEDISSMGIGLGNVYKRVKEMYKNSEVEIFSREVTGTVVKIKIPQI